MKKRENIYERKMLKRKIVKEKTQKQYVERKRDIIKQKRERLRVVYEKSKRAAFKDENIYFSS